MAMKSGEHRWVSRKDARCAISILVALDAVPNETAPGDAVPEVAVHGATPETSKVKRPRLQFTTQYTEVSICKGEHKFGRK